jgi:hypothetical protein
MSVREWPCDDCKTLVGKDERVDEYMFQIHKDFECECIGQRCLPCAEAYAKQRAWGLVTKPFLTIVIEEMTRHYGEPVEVRWLQEGQIRFVVLVRRARLTDQSLSQSRGESAGGEAQAGQDQAEERIEVGDQTEGEWEAQTTGWCRLE